jgi:hypothetical protein
MLRKKVVVMPWATTGNWETEFDRTTNVLLKTIQHMGVPDEDIEADQHFLVDMMNTVGRAIEEESMHEFIEHMDVAFIGLLYHRHMPFLDEDGGKITYPDTSPNDYAVTMSLVLTALERQIGIPKDLLTRGIERGSDHALKMLRRPESFDDESLVLHTHVVAMCIIGMLIHLYMPFTDKTPEEQQ